MMRITTVGTGTAAPSPHRVCASHVVDAGSVKLLLDCGSGCVFRMSNLGVDWMRITHVAISHFHPDHTSDIPSLLHAWRYGAIPWRSEPATLIGPAGITAFFDSLNATFGGGLHDLGFPFTVRELQPGESAQLGDSVTLSCTRVPHTGESVAYSVVVGERRLVYTGDTAFDAALGEWAAGCDLLLAECSLPSGMAVPAHLTPEQCGELAAIAHPGALALTHFYPPVEMLDIAQLVGARYQGPVHLAHDGWTIEIEE